MWLFKIKLKLNMLSQNVKNLWNLNLYWRGEVIAYNEILGSNELYQTSH